MICYLKLRHADDPLTSPKNVAAIVYFSLMSLLGWMSVIGTIGMMIGDKSNPLLFCQVNQETCPVI